MHHSHPKGQLMQPFFPHLIDPILRNHVLHRPIWPVNLSVVLQFSTEFTSISCRIELCFKSVFVVAINEVNKKQFIVLLRGKT